MRAGITTSVACALVAASLWLNPVSGETQDLEQIRTQWRLGNYQAVIGSLRDYLIGLGEKYEDFEADYLMATALCGVNRETGCQYFLAMQRVYPSDRVYEFDGSAVTLRNARTTYCPQPPPPTSGPGVSSSTITRLPTRREVLDRLPPPDLPRGPKGLRPFEQPVPRGESLRSDVDGVYELIHDGWRGTLRLSESGGHYIGADQRPYDVLVRVSDHHIVFYIVGLGGENADATGGQKFEGYLMTQTRDAIAGLTWWQERPFGFYAIKQPWGRRSRR